LRITFNGFAEDLDCPSCSVQELLDRTQEDDPAVIVEINGRYVYRRDFRSTIIKDRDCVEFIHPSFGG
jgi:thiamine biosynthesis protein ThiS